MIATVQNTTRRVTIDGKEVEVWEALAQSGIRFHLFVLGAAIMSPVGSRIFKDQANQMILKFQGEMKDEKPPASETALLPDVVRVVGA